MRRASFAGALDAAIPIRQSERLSVGGIMKRACLVLLGTLSLGACASGGTMVTNEQASRFAPGDTTEAQVVAAFGKPTTRTVKADGKIVLLYQHVSAHVTPETLIPVVGLFAGGSKGTQNAATFTFDASGKLIDHETSETAVDVRSGLFNQK